MEYDEEDFLMLSGIQHFEFCRRQWALIHIEQQWNDNLRTIEGEIFHKNAHNDKFVEKRKDIIITRGMPIFSKTMGVRGVCDIVEFVRDDAAGVNIFGREGKYCIEPVEYKHGEPKETDVDILQVVAQAMCLEEMMLCQIDKAFLYYEATRRRQPIVIDADLRDKVKKEFVEMHQMYSRRYTPKVKVSKSCNACSLKDICLPKLCSNRSVNDYIADRIIGENHEKTS